MRNDLSANYLASNSASSTIFIQWKLEELSHEAIQPIDWPSITSLSSINREPLRLEVLPIALTPIQLEISPLRSSVMEYLARQSEQRPFYSQFNQFTLFRYPTDMTSATPQ